MQSVTPEKGGPWYQTTENMEQGCNYETRLTPLG
jgi:hypothetical protein